MKFFIFVLVFVQFLSASEIPTLRFDNKITWKQIFDNGFRPKHLEGLESHKCVSHNQEFLLQFRDREPKFKFDKGSIDYGFFHDDFLQMVWYQGSEPITLEEGKRRADEFKKVFDGYIIQELTMPRLIDPNGLVDAGNDENNVKVRVGEYLIWYGFDNSMRKDKPIIPHFYITWNFPGRPDVRLKDARDVVRPPGGYEWYSLDPKVNTPDPGSQVESAHINSNDGETPESSDKSSINKASEKSKTQKKNQFWLWIIGLVGVVLVMMWLILRKRQGGF